MLDKKPYYEQVPLRFRCTGCGRCCTGNSATHYVAVSAREQERIRESLGLTRDWFRRRYLEPLAEGGHGIRLGSDGRCPFLTRDGRCHIYAARPGQCRTYPFWPEVVSTATTWRAEARRCEGIDCGPVIPLSEIRRRIRSGS